MRNLLLFIWKHYFFFLFVAVETFCFFLVIQNNYYQKASFINSSNQFSANILSASARIKEYFNLRSENEILAAENAELRKQILSSYSIILTKQYTNSDTLLQQKYVFTNAKVVNNSTNRRNNFITLNKGLKQGIKKDMAVITNSGVIGQVKDVSDNFCTVMSLLHSKTIISSKIKKDGSYGPLTWDEDDNYNTATLHDIPTHVRLKKGDTIVTSPYSLTFPENIVIGTVESFGRKSRENFYTIKINLATDFKKITNVYVVTNIFKDEQQSLENKSETEKK